MELSDSLRIQAHANRLANHRLHGAMAALPAAEFHAVRTGFFASLAATLNHILAVDRYYIGALLGEAAPEASWARFVPDDTLAALARRQRDRAAHVLAHLFMHQTHHRGQVHTMLSGTAVAPPQLDEFLMPSEPHLREADMAALGWRESEVYGVLPGP